VLQSIRNKKCKSNVLAYRSELDNHLHAHKTKRN
jgi:hypothetical protein